MICLCQSQDPGVAVDPCCAIHQSESARADVPCMPLVAVRDPRRRNACTATSQIRFAGEYQRADSIFGTDLEN
jgi:hypothetical protein